MSDVFVLDALRSPFGRRDGSLKELGRNNLRDVMRCGLADRNGLNASALASRDMNEIESLLRSVQEACAISGAAACDDPRPPENWSAAAQRIANHWNIPREMADIFAAESHEKAVLARQKGFLNDEILPLTTGSGETVVRDEFPRANWSAESVSLPTATEVHCAPAAVGAAAILISGKMDAMTPLARLVSISKAADEPELPGSGMIAAVEKVLTSSGFTALDVGLWEFHELSAPHMLAMISELDLPFDRVNVWGGAIARGNPGCAAAMHVVGTLARKMQCYQVRVGVAAYWMAGLGHAALLIRTD